MSYIDRSWLPVADDTRGKLLVAALVLAHLAIVPAFVFVTRVGQPRHFGFFVVITLGLLLFDLLLLLAGQRTAESTTYSPHVETLLDLRVVSVVLAVGVLTFVTMGLGLAFYLVMSAFFTMLLVRTFVVAWGEEAIGGLVLVVLGSFLLLVAQLSAYQYFVRTADTVFHTTTIMRFSSTGFIESAAAGRYGELPVFHSLMAAMVEVGDRRSRLYVGVALAALFQVAIVAFYVLLRKVGEPVGVSFAGALLVGVNMNFLVWGTQNHPQSLSFFFLILFLLIVGTRFHDRRSTMLSVVLVVTWVLTHQLSLLMAISIMAVPIAVSYLYVNLRQTSFEKKIRTAGSRYLVLVAVLLTYWAIVTRILWEPLSWLLFTSPSARGVPTRSYVTSVYETFGPLVQASLVEIVDKSQYAVWLALAALGGWTAVRAVGRADRYRLAALLGFLPAAVFFFPNPTWLLFQGTVPILRWGIIALPFVVLLPAIGLRRLVSSTDGTGRTVLVVLLVGTLVFLSIGSGMASPNVTDISGFEKGVPEYLSESNVAATEYVSAYTKGTPTYGTSVIPFYLTRYNWRYDEPPDANYFLRADMDSGEFLLQPGMNFIQTDQMTAKNTRVMISADPTVFAPVSDEMVAVNETMGSRVYDADATEIYYGPPREAGTRESPPRSSGS